MARWSSEFKRRLRESDVYAPQFRLVIGTPAISNKIGAWEEPHAKVLEIGSHPGVASYAGVTGASGSGAVNGKPYQFLVGLTQQLTLGAQSVTPRKFAYSGAQMTAVVTRAAAEFAMQMPIGTLSRLQCRLVGNDKPDTDFETIHFGTYRGCKWNGQTYTLQFGDALEAAEQRVTDKQDWGAESSDAVRSQSYSWFAGCGQTMKTSATLTAFDGSQMLDTVTTYDAKHISRMGHAYKLPTAFGGQEYSYGHLTIPEPGVSRFHNMWAKVQNSSNNQTYVYYSGIFKDPSDGSMRLGSATSNGVWRYRGRQNGSDVTGGIGANSVITNVCVIHGTPVTELVNTIYIGGYHEQMVCGLFGDTIDEARDSLNVTDIQTAHQLFNRAYQRINGYLPTRSGFIPLFAPISSNSKTGYSDMKKLMAKWGVFPRFKEGGYGIGLTSQSFDRTHMTGRDTLILAEDIESAEFDLNDPQSRGSYEDLRLTTDDHEDDDPGHKSSSTTTTGASPLVPELILNNSDVAPGAFYGEFFFDYFNDVIFSRWFTSRRSSVNLRLCGLRFATLAPGDHVDVFIGNPAKPNLQVAWGPSKSNTAGKRSHVLNSLNSADAPQAGDYMVTSVKVDWIGAKVHLTLNKSQSPFITKQFKGEVTGQHASATGLPQTDIDGGMG